MARTAATVLILWLCLPEVLLAGMVLEAGEIDSSKVRVGAFAEVVYGKGARDTVSGQWEKLDTASGYIKAVDAESLTLALKEGLGKKRIAFARIQTLLLAASSRDMAKLKKATGVELSFARIDDRNWRIYRKLISGALVGAGAGLAVASLVIARTDANGQEDELFGFYIGIKAAIYGGIAYVVGVPVGASRVDPHDRVIASLAGSLIGGGVAYGLTKRQRNLWPSVLICPPVGPLRCPSFYESLPRPAVSPSAWRLVPTGASPRSPRFDSEPADRCLTRQLRTC